MVQEYRPPRMVQEYRLPRARQECSGVVTTAQALAMGWTKDAIRRAVRAGRWRRLARGVYLAGGGPVTPWQTAVALTRATGGVVSHVSAARVFGWWGIDPGEAVTVPPGVHRRSRPGVRVHRAALTDAEVLWLGEVAVTAPLRTVRDLCRQASPLQAVAAMDAAVRAGQLTPGDLAGAAAAGPARVRRLVGLADARSESPLETAWRLALHESGVRVTPQVEVDTPQGRRRIDLACLPARVGLECDGRAVHAAPPALYDDRWRANALAALGWLILRVTWWDLYHRREAVIAQLVAACRR